MKRFFNKACLPLMGLFVLLFVITGGAQAQDQGVASSEVKDPLKRKSSNPAMKTTQQEGLHALDFLIGGQWKGTFEAPSGEQVTLARTYEWSFDERLIIGKSFAYREGRPIQTRQTIFAWDDRAKQIIFWDFMEAGGYGEGFVEVREEDIYMEARIVGSDHPNWRLVLIQEDDQHQTIRVEIPEQGEWVDAGTFRYARLE